MVNKKIKAVKNIKAPKAPRQPRSARPPRQPAQPKKAPTQNVYVYSGGQPQVYSQSLPSQFYQQPIQNPMMNLVQSQPSAIPVGGVIGGQAPLEQDLLTRKDKIIAHTKEGKPILRKMFEEQKPTEMESLFSKLYVEPKSVETQTEIAEEDMLERPEPSKTPTASAIIPSEAVEEESLFSELFFTPPSVNELNLQTRRQESELEPRSSINWMSFNPDYNMTEGELDYQLADAERRYREQQRYLGEIKDTPARSEGNILLFPEQRQNDLEAIPLAVGGVIGGQAPLARVEPIGEPRAEPRPIRTRPIEIKPVRYEAEEDVVIYPEFPAEQKEVIQRPPKREVIQPEIQPEVKPQIKPVRYEAEEEIIEQPIFQAPKKEVIQRPPKKEAIQSVEDEEEAIKQEVAQYERLMSKTKEIEENPEQKEKIYRLDETPQIQELGQRAEAVPAIQAEVQRNPVGRPKKGEDFEPQPDLELTPEEEGLRMALYNDLTKDRNRELLANSIRPFLRENPWANELRDENGEKLARTSETLRDDQGNAIKNKKGTGYQQRDFNKNELKSILDKLVREKIKRERFVK